MKILAWILGLAVVSASAADKPGDADWVSLKAGKLNAFTMGKSDVMSKPVQMPFEILVATNATFTVKQGKPRTLKEGQMLSKDGSLSSPDGTITPVFDHVTSNRGHIVQMTDGDVSRVTSTVRFPDGSSILPDGTYYAKGGNKRKLLDGEILRMDGSPVPASDSISLRDGKVWVQKDGSLIRLKPGQTIMMADGTKVFSDGTVSPKGLNTIKLSEGQILPVQGVVVRPR